MELVVVGINGQATGRKVTLPAAVFGGEINHHVMYLDVKQYLANQRQGTHKSKERAEIARTTKKLKKQTGTGGARAGSMKSPIFVGGGRVFGPRPRDYSFKLNKKVKALARLSAFASLAKDAKVKVMENPAFTAPKTKDVVALLNGLQLTGRRTLLVTGAPDANVVLSARNVQRVKVTVPSALTTYDLLNADALVLSEAGLQALEAMYAARA